MNCDGSKATLANAKSVLQVGFTATIGGMTVDRCPLATIYGPQSAKLSKQEYRNARAILNVIKLWRLYRAGGALPYDGGLFRQPAIIVACFDALSRRDGDNVNHRELCDIISVGLGVKHG